MKNKSHSIEEKKELVSNYKTSGQSVADYCKAKGISTSQFYTWQKSINSEGKTQAPKASVPDSKLKVQNEILKEMLADSIAEKRKAA